MVKLVYRDQGWQKVLTMNESKTEATIGRNPTCDIIPSNESVSRLHAMLSLRKDRLFVTDPPSGYPTNGIKVNGVKMQPGERVELFPGCELTCGVFSIRIEADDDPNPSMEMTLVKMQPVTPQSEDVVPHKRNDPDLREKARQNQTKNNTHDGTAENKIDTDDTNKKEPQQPNTPKVEPPPIPKAPMTVAELKEKLKLQEGIMADYERKAEFTESVVIGLRERISMLEEQLEHQKLQNLKLQEERDTANEKVSLITAENNALKETNSNKSSSLTGYEKTVGELKSLVAQKDRQIADLQRDYDIIKFSSDRERENAETLKEAIATLNENLEQSQQHNRDLQQIVEMHESELREYKYSGKKMAECQAPRMTSRPRSGDPKETAKWCMDEMCKDIEESMKFWRDEIANIGRSH